MTCWYEQVKWWNNKKLIKINIVKKSVYDQLVNKLNTIDTMVPNCELVSKDIMIQENKILKKRVKMSIKNYLTLLNLLRPRSFIDWQNIFMQGWK